MPAAMQTRADFLRLPGVIDALSCVPEPGCVTLVVAPDGRGWARTLDPGEGDGTGMCPIGVRVYEQDADYLTLEDYERRRLPPELREFADRLAADILGPRRGGSASAPPAG